MKHLEVRQKYSAARRISTLFSVFHLVMEHCVSCLIYYFLTFDFVYEAPHSKPNLTVLSFIAIRQYFLYVLNQSLCATFTLHIVVP